MMLEIVGVNRNEKEMGFDFQFFPMDITNSNFCYERSKCLFFL